MRWPETQQSVTQLLMSFGGVPVDDVLQATLVMRDQTALDDARHALASEGSSSAQTLGPQEILAQLYDNDHLEVRGSQMISWPIHSGYLAASLRQLIQPSHQPHPLENANDATVFMTLQGRVLVAEDNAINQRLVTMLLERHGINCDCVSNGLEAVDSRQRVRYDAILMDVKMPEMDGYEATQEIRQYEQAHQLPAIPIIALTASALRGDQEQCFACGMNDFLTKPLNVAELVSRLKKYLVPMSPLLNQQNTLTNAVSTALPNALPNAVSSEKASIPTVQDSLIDESYLASIVHESGGDQDFLREIVDLFIQQADATITEMEQLLPASLNATVASDTNEGLAERQHSQRDNEDAVTIDYARLEKLSHCLAGMSTNMACAALYEQSVALERQSHDNMMADSRVEEAVIDVDNLIDSVVSLRPLYQQSVQAWHNRLAVMSASGSAQGNG